MPIEQNSDPCPCGSCRIRRRSAERVLLRTPADRIVFDNDINQPLWLRTGAMIGLDDPCARVPTDQIRAFTSVSTYPDRSVLQCNAHDLETGDPVVVLTDGRDLPMGLTGGVTYWAIVLGPDQLQFATSHQNAVDGMAIDLTSPGRGKYLFRGVTK